MKINGNALRVGNVIEHNGRLWVTVKTQAVKPGKAAPSIKSNLKICVTVVSSMKDLELMSKSNVYV